MIRTVEKGTDRERERQAFSKAEIGIQTRVERVVELLTIRGSKVGIFFKQNFTSNLKSIESNDEALF